MKAGIVAVAVLAGMCGLDTYAHAETGNEMAENCRAFLKEKIPSDKYFNAGVCAGFVHGVTDTLVLARVASPETIAICIPHEGFTMGQAAKVLLKYLDDHPETLHENVSMLAAQAYRAAYPCN
ncbi:Rap1a/Tai family immunity protein [Pseudomonas simiae]|jgi:hypothetical protein|uniref:Rap1a immunity protein domain-containing protein n=1 Tax=Pseudomonas simiae TaxID=321846 RepID=U1UN66_9PSED|nr:Rap1a/Tai family immunity protein [Pseudomonas simiae]ERH56497.1 hypothetical protein O204_04560 [Pseudomonas simiae]